MNQFSKEFMALFDGEDLKIDVDIYKDDLDDENECSVYISHNGSSGVSYHHLTSKEAIANGFLKYLENYL